MATRYHPRFANARASKFGPAKSVPKAVVDQAGDVINPREVHLSQVDTFDPANMVVKSMSKCNLAYPMYNVEGKTHPILIETPFVTLRRYPLSKFRTETKAPMFLLHESLDGDQEMDQLFRLFGRLDEHMEKNLPEIIKAEPKIKGTVSYSPCVHQPSEVLDAEGKPRPKYVKLKPNLQAGTVTGTVTGTVNGPVNIPVNTPVNTPANADGADGTEGTKVPVVKVFYKSNHFAGPKYKVHTLAELGKILKPGRRVRFILTINKLWFNTYNLGLGIKILQMEIDNTFTDKFKMLQMVKRNDVSMFDKFQNKSDDYQEYLQRRIQCGPTKQEKKTENGKIINLIQHTSETYLANDNADDFVPVETVAI